MEIAATDMAGIEGTKGFQLLGAMEPGYPHENGEKGRIYVNKAAFDSEIEQNVARCWNQICEKLREAVGVAAYDGFLRQLRFEKFDSNDLVVSVPTAFLRKHVDTHYKQNIYEAAHSVFSEQGHVELFKDFKVKVIERAVGGTAKSKPLTVKPKTGKPDIDFQDTDLNIGLPEEQINTASTFDNFLRVDENEIAVSMLEHFVNDQEEGSDDLLYVYGPPGSGKTHLLDAVANDFKSRGIPYTKVSMNSLVTMHGSHHLYELQMRKIKSSPGIVLLDDLLVDTHMVHSYEAFCEIQNACDRLVVASRLSPYEMKETTKIRNHLIKGLSIGINHYRKDTLLEILSCKLLEGIKDNDDQSNWQKDWSAWQQDCKSIIRSLNSGHDAVTAAKRMAYHVKTHNSLPNENEIRRLVSDMSEAEIVPKVSEILRLVKREYHVTGTDLRSKQRSRAIVVPRQVAMHLVVELTGKSLPETGRFFDRDHTTVLHACKRVRERIKSDYEFSRQIERMTAELKAL